MRAALTSRVMRMLRTDCVFLLLPGLGVYMLFFLIPEGLEILGVDKKYTRFAQRGIVYIS